MLARARAAGEVDVGLGGPGRGRARAGAARGGPRAVRAGLRGGARVGRRSAPGTPQRAATRHARLEEALAGESLASSVHHCYIRRSFLVPLIFKNRLFILQSHELNAFAFLFELVL